MAIDLKLIDKLLADYKSPEDIIGENGLLKQLTKALLERAMQAELTEHLGYEKHDPAGHNSGNSRNGGTTKTLKGDFGEIPLETPRDRNGSYEPKIIGKRQTRFTGFDDKIISMYARGMSTREIQGHLEEIYKVEVSPTLISNVTEAVMEEVKIWQSRPLDSVYPIVYLDALVVKIRETGHVRNKAIYVVIGVNMQGHRHQEWLKFLRVIDGVTPPHKELHVIADNYATHKHPQVQKWLARHPRFHMYFTPTSSSWLNMVERFFRDLTEQRLRCGIFRDVQELTMAIGDYIDKHNDDPKPFVWTAKASDVLEKVKRARAVLDNR